MLENILMALAIWLVFFIPTAWVIIRTSRVVKLSPEDIKRLFPYQD